MKSKTSESGGGAGGVATDLVPRGADGKSERRVLYEGPGRIICNLCKAAHSTLTRSVDGQNLDV